MRLRSVFAAGILACAFTVPAFAQDAPPCRAHENGSALDFWVGDWRVTSRDGETEYGSNRIVADLDGCAVFEHWTSARGGAGKSLFTFDARTGDWAQVWVTPNTGRPGWLKHKKLIERFDDGGVRFQGTYPGDKEGVEILDRTTLTPAENGAVRQHIEISTDGGATWRTTFDALYVRN